MAETVTYTLRVPSSPKNEVIKIAKRDGTSVNQFITLAVTEKISVLETEVFFTERGQLADMEKFKDTFYRDGGTAPSEGDEPLDHSTS